MNPKFRLGQIVAVRPSTRNLLCLADPFGIVEAISQSNCGIMYSIRFDNIKSALILVEHELE